MIIKIVTISLMAVFYICYFAKLISQKKQGIKTDQLEIRSAVILGSGSKDSGRAGWDSSRNAGTACKM